MWEVKYLNAELLDLKLWGEGCHLYQICQTGDGESCLIQTRDTPQESLSRRSDTLREHERWQVVHAERGVVQNLLFESTDEAEACAFMYQEIKRTKHPHLAGLFQTDAEAEQLCQVLTQLQIQFSRDIIPFEGWQPRVRVYDQDIFTVERHFGSQLPLRKWLTVPERINVTLARLRKFDPYNRYAEITTNPPIGSEATLSALEAQHGIKLPEVYRTFLLEVCNGGNWERLGHYWSVEEVMVNNSAELWNQPLPEFLAKLKAAKSKDWLKNPGGQQYPGLLRIVDWDNPVRDLFLTQEGYEVEIQGDLINFSEFSPEQWLKDFLDDIQYGLSTIEQLLAFLRSGEFIQDYAYFHSVNVARLLAETIGLDIDPELTNEQVMVMRHEIDHKINQWRIENMGKMWYNFGFNAEQVELRTQRILERLGYIYNILHP
ncbi:SMI1/KNR4 family protein [Calothrix sp. PCC 6303]|uniref:SMI1/KNR4 family protein n=1 Tax=Calothrix sp. PCC 6303 TaxID=1170562 RepID=UPI0002A050F1|nr:SMI1/KNR4 family protein [Calothrix sp. PCC 6303]AFZ01518.1 Cell wall assembly/cell proliferation coordinating protein, KNR4 [Calothrix sp. PCC 6303]